VARAVHIAEAANERLQSAFRGNQKILFVCESEDLETLSNLI
jgi:hypothetical protein